jgi:hypothetical protein
VALLVAALDVAQASAPLIPWRHETLSPRPEPVARILDAGDDAPPRVLRPHRGAPTLESLPGNLASMWGIATLPGHDPARSVRLDELASRLGGTQMARLTRLLRFEWAMDPEEVAGQPTRWALREGPRLSRAWLVPAVEIADDAPALDRLASAPFDPDAVAVVAPSPTASAFAGGSAYGECKVERFAPERVELACTSSGDAIVVLAEAHAPGWTVTVDGRDAPIERANLVMRGVRVGSGSHRLVFVYATPGLAAGLWIALAAVVLAAWVVRRGRVAGRAPLARLRPGS